MPISWKTSDGNTGIAENDYEFAMQHKGKSDREELAPQDRINQAFGEGPAAPEIKDQNAPYSWGMGEDIKGLGVQPDAPADEWQKAYGDKRAGEFIPISATQTTQRGHTSDIPELGPAETKRIWEDYGRHDHPQTKYPYEDTTKEEMSKRLKDVGEGIFRRGLPHVEDFLKNLPSDLDAYDLNKEFFHEGLTDEQKKASPSLLYIKRKPLTAQTIHEQLASFQQRLDATPPEEAGAFRKFLGSLNIMPAPGKPESEWTAKEHFGVLLNTAMAGMGGGYRMPRMTGPGFGARPPASFDYPMDFKDYYPANNANRKGGVTFREGEKFNPSDLNQALRLNKVLEENPELRQVPFGFESEQIQKLTHQEYLDMMSSEDTTKYLSNKGIKPLTTETEPQLQQAQHQGTPWPEGWATKLPEGKRILSASDYPHIQKAFKEAVEQGNKTSSEVSNYILEKHGIDLSSYMVKRLQETSGVKLEDRIVNATNSGWTPELIGKLKEGFDKGKSFQTLADELGQSRGQVAGKVSRLLKEGVLVDRPTMTSGVEANPEKMARFKELRSKGLSYKEIAQDLNITTSYARVIASRNKI